MLSAKMADGIAISFHESMSYFNPKKTFYTSNPCVNDLIAYEPKSKLDDYVFVTRKQTVLIVGGSLGANKINEIALEIIPRLLSDDFQIFFITGKKHYKYVLANIELHPQLNISPYASDLVDMIY